jgi:predicted RNA-binding Zn-ribbon protein involved in translation (DUF1610 family)
MSSYTSGKYQVPLFRDCPRCKQSISLSFSYCPHCGFSLIQQAPNYTDPSIPNYIKPPKGVASPYPEYPWQIDPPPKVGINSNVVLPKEYCPHCGQLIIRSKPLVDASNLHGRNNYSSSNDGSCFIVTACNADSETLNTFYSFRDEILLCSSIGKKLVQLYYHFSPSIAKLIQQSEVLQSSILSMLLKPLATLLRLTALRAKEP